DGPAISYGKGAIVGVAGELEHGGACVHPMLGKPMRAAIGGGKAVIGSNVKVAAAGALLDVPLGHKDDSWSFAHFDTITASVADAPRPDEILVVMAIADGGRLRNRCGSEPIRQTAISAPGIRRGMVAPGFLENPEVRRWLNGVEPAWTTLEFNSLNALRHESLASNHAI